MMQTLTKKRNALNNKGFSLIELIIVIAIMAALIAILAPQYLKYVEKSRISADETTADEILNAVQVQCADPANIVTAGFTVTWDTSAGTIASSDTTATAVTTAKLGAVMPVTALAQKSALHSAQDYRVTVTFTAATATTDAAISVAGAWIAE